MFASIIKSAVFADDGRQLTLPRVTVVVPTSPSGGGVTYWTRQGESKGIGWREVALPELLDNEVLLGSPASKTMTANDWASISTPTVLLQKLTREVDGVMPTKVDAKAMLQSIVDDASLTPALLAKYLNANRSVTQVIPQHIVVAPIPTVNLVPESYVAQVVAPIVPPVVEEQPQSMQHQEEEEPMNTTTLSSSYAVLTVPPVDLYIERTQYGATEAELYDFARSNQQNVLLTGDAGTGKTSSARYYAATHNLPFVTIECTQTIDQSITQGRFVPTGRGNEMAWKYSQLATAIQGPAVILINELSRMSPKAASLFLRLLEERELVVEPLNEVIKVHPECIFVADQNVGSGYRGTQRQDDALVDRFNVKIEFAYDRAIEEKFITSPALLDFAVSIRQAREVSDEFSANVTTRMLKNFQKQAKGIGFEFAVHSLLNNFPKDEGEREALQHRFDINLDRIASELGVDKGGYNK